MAGNKMARSHLAPDRLHLGAVRLGDGAAGVETAASLRHPTLAFPLAEPAAG